MRRREFIATVGALLAASSSARGQPRQRLYRIGLLRIGQPPPSFIEPFRQGLRELGYDEAHNLIIDFALAERAEHLPEIATALARRKVDVIVASGAAAVLPARDASATIPVIFVAGIDPIGTGLAIRGLAQPGANVTGITTVQIDLTAKRMQLLKEVMPAESRVAFLSRETNPGNAEYVREATRAAAALGVALHVIPAQSEEDFSAAFQEAVAGGAGALIPMDDAAFTSGRGKLIELANHHRLPAVYPIREFVIDGGLVSLGPNYPEVYRRAAAFVDKIFRGASPSDLPVEQPTKFELVVNLKAAGALGVVFPPTLIARADEVIE